MVDDRNDKGEGDGKADEPDQSALASLEEGFEETLTLHRLGLVPMLKSFRTTNAIENVNCLLGQLTRNVRRWPNSSQRHRWVAAGLLDVGPRLRRINGYRHLPTFRHALQTERGRPFARRIGSWSPA
ncbi:MAG: hypothetical protein O2782_21550 [bacterium]|nr:hypothetical protein [bacterium]